LGQRQPASPSLFGLRVKIWGAGPAGLRTAIELLLHGASVVIADKRASDLAVRHNVLKLWPGVVEDLLSIGAKVLWRRFCTDSGSNKISIKRLQLILLKIALVLGAEFQLGSPFCGFDTTSYDLFVGADGENSSVAAAAGFEKLLLKPSGRSMGITFNFQADAPCQTTEINRARQYGMYTAFFDGIQQRTGIALENLVYFKAETHYFVMAAAARDADSLQCDRANLEAFAREIGRTCGLPEHLPLLPGSSVFDFTTKACCTEMLRFVESKPVLLVGDSLMAPFWPQGTGGNRAVLSAMDATYLASRLRLVHDCSGVELVVAEARTLLEKLRHSGETSLKPNRGSCGSTGFAWTTDPRTRYFSLAAPPPLPSPSPPPLPSPSPVVDVSTDDDDFKLVFASRDIALGSTGDYVALITAPASCSAEQSDLVTTGYEIEEEYAFTLSPERVQDSEAKRYRCLTCDTVFKFRKNFLRHKKTRRECLGAFGEETESEETGVHHFQTGHQLGKRQCEATEEEVCLACDGHGCSLCTNKAKRRRVQTLLSAIERGSRVEAFELLDGLVPNEFASLS
jgi:2-polyprenyl-6-methoxyphenol hydroxylase-like FAD-dependent oxidoreductase